MCVSDYRAAQLVFLSQMCSQMSPVHSLTILLCLVPFALAGGSVTPDDFNEMCRSQYEGELSPFELANLDLYDDLSTVTSTVVLVQ